ncbi:unnamed protein product [Amoebophrya sp. A120]|nr:unnamed protein product [Amoebophrya sp. A120]|eukprot:GSA120T00000043001.1
MTVEPPPCPEPEVIGLASSTTTHFVPRPQQEEMMLSARISRDVDHTSMPHFPRGHTQPLLRRQRRELQNQRRSDPASCILVDDTTNKETGRAHTPVGPTCDPCCVMTVGRARGLGCCEQGLCEPCLCEDNWNPKPFSAVERNVCDGRVRACLLCCCVSCYIPYHCGPACALQPGCAEAAAADFCAESRRTAAAARAVREGMVGVGASCGVCCSLKMLRGYCNKAAELQKAWNLQLHEVPQHHGGQSSVVHGSTSRAEVTLVQQQPGTTTSTPGRVLLTPGTTSATETSTTPGAAQHDDSHHLSRCDHCFRGVSLTFAGYSEAWARAAAGEGWLFPDTCNQLQKVEELERVCEEMRTKCRTV